MFLQPNPVLCRCKSFSSNKHMAQECCHDEQPGEAAPRSPVHDHDHDHDHDHEHGHGDDWKQWLAPVVSAVVLAAGLWLDHTAFSWFGRPFLRSGWYVLAYLPVAWPVWVQAVRSMRGGTVFSEFFLMGIATAGAFYLGQYAEGVAVMLFYAVGEAFQHAAVQGARRNISALLDVRPTQVRVVHDNHVHQAPPEKVAVGATIRLLPGERVALDGVLLGDNAAEFDTAALSGESLPVTIAPGGGVMAGSIALGRMLELRTVKPYEESTLARILHLVQDATQRKAPTEQFIRRFAKIYTPIVCALALLIVLVPAWLVQPYVWTDWLYRALVFLVISCPCALVISIPLGYFGGIGAASRHGILFKGSNYLDLLTQVNTLATDKTGTLTRGKFTVSAFESVMDDLPAPTLLRWTASLEQASNHPVAQALVGFAHDNEAVFATAAAVEEFGGMGLRGQVENRTLLVGNRALMEKFGVEGDFPEQAPEGSIRVLIAVNGRIAGHFLVADTLKSDASEAIGALRRAGVRRIVLLSGDRPEIAAAVGQTLGLDATYGALLPEQKVQKIEALKSDPAVCLAFAGDGLNDAPALARADVGIAMGGLGADAAIETADVIIQTDQPSRIATAIRISRATRAVVWQNIGLAFGVKSLVLLLGAGGLATMWEAVIADVGVALLAILNAVRVLHMRF